MSSYKHGIYGSITPTAMPASNTAERGITAVIGTAPVHLLTSPAAAVKTPILLNGKGDVYTKLGYSSDVNNYTIMQAVHSFFDIFDIGPIVVINVLDPATHTTAKTSDGSMTGGVYTLTDKGVLLSSLVVKNSGGTTTYVLGTDYTASFNSDGTVAITRITTGAISTATASIKTTYNILDPSKVTAVDVVAGVAYVDRIFQATNVMPEILIAPGWSQNATVSAALIAEAQKVSTIFKATAFVDLDSSSATTISAAITAKTTAGDNVRDAYVFFPKVTTTSGVTVFLSAQMAALAQYTDAQYGGSPFVSPSNKDLKISGTVLAGGTSVLYTIDEANQLNAEGIATALNFQGWRAWGNYTGIYSQTAADAGTVYDPKDYYINIKRGFDWQSNGFIVRYFDIIDDPLNYKAVQSLITDENAYYNAFINAGLVAGMEISYDQSVNTASSILAGIIKTKQMIAPYLPTQAIVNEMQFDISMIIKALTGGAS